MNLMKDALSNFWTLECSECRADFKLTGKKIMGSDNHFNCPNCNAPHDISTLKLAVDALEKFQKAFAQARKPQNYLKFVKIVPPGFRE